ncbi:hypothetical protein ACH4CE_29530 [Streptomyces gelaticus]|uniref:hypothetical protein n=1 Tax=Streptomyces gelaticus TaxID=285446 RepID=UPI0037B630AB
MVAEIMRVSVQNPGSEDEQGFGLAGKFGEHFERVGEQHTGTFRRAATRASARQEAAQSANTGCAHTVS